jgi:drug/metabolite transporter (DMT)-like permease
MPANWVGLALLATSISAGVNTLDSHFLVRRMPGLRAYILILEAFLVPASVVLLIAFPLPAGFNYALLWVVAVSAAANATGSLLLLDAMRREDVARIMPLAGVFPVFVALMAWAFLGESLKPLQWLAIIIVVTGAVLISFKRQGTAHRFHARSFFPLLAASVLFAVSVVTNKYVLGYMSYWNSAGLQFLFAGFIFLAYCLRPSVLAEVRRIRPLVTLGVMANQAAAMAASVMGFWAVQVGPVALVSTTLNTKPLFIFAFSLLLGWLRPGFLLDDAAERSSLGLRLTGMGMIVGGVGLILLT